MKYLDYYKILGVQRGATQEEISRAYKQAARKCHPDLNKRPDAEQRFKEVNEANQVLGDPESRKRYDMLGANWKHGSSFRPPPGWGQNINIDFDGAPGGFGGGGFSDFFGQVFSGGGERRSARQRRHGGNINIEDILGGGLRFEEQGRPQPEELTMETSLVIDLEDSFRGNSRKVEVTGSSGIKAYDIKIPRGIRDGEKIRLSGQGRRGRSGRRGDLLLKIELRSHPLFQVEGDDLVTELLVPAWDAALGASVPVPTMDGEVNMTLPRGLSSGQRLRLRGKGLPRRDGGSGDLFAQLKIAVPRELSEQQEQLFLQLQQAAEKS